MARKRASMREGPLAELFRRTEKAQQQEEPQAEEPQESTVEHVPTWQDEVDTPAPPTPQPGPGEPGPSEPEPQPEPPSPEPPAPEPAAPAAVVSQPPVARYVETLPDPAPRLHRA